MDSAPKSLVQRRIRIVAILIVVASAAGAAALYFWSLNPERFAVVDERGLYRSSQPTKRQIQHLIDKLGLKTILIVRSGNSSRVPDEIQFAREKGLKVVHIPIETRKPIPESQISEFFREVDDRANWPILVHCSAGRHRTGYLCARYRIERQGWSLDRAIQELLSFGFDTEDQGVVLSQLRAYKPATTAAPTRTVADHRPERH